MIFSLALIVRMNLMDKDIVCVTDGAVINQFLQKKKESMSYGAYNVKVLFLIENFNLCNKIE